MMSVVLAKLIVFKLSLQNENENFWVNKLET